MERDCPRGFRRAVPTSIFPREGRSGKASVMPGGVRSNPGAPPGLSLRRCAGDLSKRGPAVAAEGIARKGPTATSLRVGARRRCRPGSMRERTEPQARLGPLGNDPIAQATSRAKALSSPFVG